MVETAGKLTLREVARELGRSLEQVRRYVREGKLPAQKLGMQWFVERLDLERFKVASGGHVEQDALARARALRKKIEARTGLLDVAGLVEESRRGQS